MGAAFFLWFTLWFGVALGWTAGYLVFGKTPKGPSLA